ncbi:hypothetical protein GCM10009602_47110 [Nocardiopsis tropica]
MVLMNESLAHLESIEDPALRLRAATQQLLELDRLTLRVGQIRNDCLKALQESAPSTLANPSQVDLTEAAQWVLKWIRRQRVTSFTQREAMRRLPRSQFPTSDALRDTLEILEASGHLARQEDPEPNPHGGRPPSPRYKVLRRNPEDH